MEHCSIKDDSNNMIIIRITIMAHRNIYKICCPCGGAYVGTACLGGIHGACPEAGAWGIASEVLVASGVVDEVGHALDA
jgi:hypothetical protein